MPAYEPVKHQLNRADILPVSFKTSLEEETKKNLKKYGKKREENVVNKLPIAN